MRLMNDLRELERRVTSVLMTVGLEGIPDTYSAMDERRTMKVPVKTQEAGDRFRNRRCGVEATQAVHLVKPLYVSPNWFHGY